MIKTSKALECESCKEWMHIRCGIDITPLQYNQVTAGTLDFHWTCQDCASQQIAPAPASPEPPTKRRRMITATPPRSVLGIRPPTPQFTISPGYRGSLPAPVSPIPAPVSPIPGSPLPAPVSPIPAPVSPIPGSPLPAPVSPIPGSLDISNIPDVIAVAVPDLDQPAEPELVPQLPSAVAVGDLPPLSFTEVPGATKRSKPRLVSSHNHVYNFKKTLKRTGATVWQCSVRSKLTYCTAVVTQLGDTFTPMHNLNWWLK